MKFMKGTLLIGWWGPERYQYWSYDDYQHQMFETHNSRRSHASFRRWRDAGGEPGWRAARRARAIDRAR